MQQILIDGVTLKGKPWIMRKYRVKQISKYPIVDWASGKDGKLYYFLSSFGCSTDFKYSYKVGFSIFLTYSLSQWSPTNKALNLFAITCISFFASD